MYWTIYNLSNADNIIMKKAYSTSHKFKFQLNKQWKSWKKSKLLIIIIERQNQYFKCDKPLLCNCIDKRYSPGKHSREGSDNKSVNKCLAYNS